MQRNLQTVLESLNDNSELFARMVIHPSTNYPGRTQENILTQLLRKKLEPDVEELVAEGRETAKLATPEGIAELQGIWDEIREWTHGRIATYVRDEAGDVYTKEERELGAEHVRTGLKKALDEDSDEDEDDDDEADDDIDEDGDNADGEKGEKQIARGPEPETLMWFSSRGDFEVPRNIEFERKAGVKRGLEGVNIPPETMDGVTLS